MVSVSFIQVAKNGGGLIFVWGLKLGSFFLVDRLEGGMGADLGSIIFLIRS